ncbi:kinetochore protein NDC80 homolog [Rhipicephalus sanguineus]|uniref:kinetochore protein NDC80 homolog n=1 Tax=Rhipicephalus sanguineus TaxID=34632 RepID=UPI00189431E3|nr:kinetochore protein NDC80 homolog [Rhipicephalus sanguineus]
MEARSARSSKKSLATPRTLIPRRSSSVDARSSVGGMTGRSSRSAWTPAMSGGRNRRFSSLSQVDRLSQGAPRVANLKDQRPFNDKAYVSHCVDMLYEFLKEKAYPNYTTPQALSRMSAKEFENVITFLIQFFEPNFKLGGGTRMEDAVLEQLRRLGYPYPLHKSMLMGIGSQPHKALAIITWLADFAKYLDSVNPLDDFFTAEDSPIGTPGPRLAGGSGTVGLLLKHCLQRQDDDSSFDEDAFLDNLVLEAVGPIQPVEEIEKKLAEQHQEVQRLAALVEAQEMRKKELQQSKLKIQCFEKYFEEMAAHFKARRVDVEKNEKKLATLVCQGSMDLRAENAQLQASFKSSTTCLRRVLPRNTLDDFDLRPVEDARSLQRHIASNTAAAAKVADQLGRMEKELQGCIQQDQDLCEQYTFKVEDLERDLQLKQELIAKHKSYWAEQTADTRKNAHDLDKEYADICKATSDLRQKLTTDPEIKAAQESEKRLANLQKQLAETIARQDETIAASDAALHQCADAARVTYREIMDTIKEMHDSFVDAIEENMRLRKQ